jgi:hypothetical protein
LPAPRFGAARWRLAPSLAYDTGGGNRPNPDDPAVQQQTTV